MTAQTHVDVVGPGEHVVQFYDHANELAAAVSRFLATGFARGEAALVVALPEHLKAFEECLLATGIDVERARAEGSYVTLDARQAARELMGQQGPDPQIFADKIGSLVAELGAQRPLRVYGEIVAVLWDAGEVSAAFELEQLWNELGKELEFSLYCAYPARSLDGARDALCRHHTGVVPALSAPVTPAGVVVRRLEATAYAVPVARQMLREVLAGWDLGCARDDAMLVLAELVGNAVEHARGPFEVTVSRVGCGVRIEVSDPLPELPRMRRREDLAEGGRGLLIVRELAAAWGNEVREDGKTTWAEVHCERPRSQGTS